MPPLAIAINKDQQIIAMKYSAIILCCVVVLTATDIQAEEVNDIKIVVKDNVVSATVLSVARQNNHDVPVKIVLSVFPAKAYLGDTIYYSVVIENLSQYYSLDCIRSWHLSEFYIEGGNEVLLSPNIHLRPNNGFDSQLSYIPPEKNMLLGTVSYILPHSFENDYVFFQELLSKDFIGYILCKVRLDDTTKDFNGKIISVGTPVSVSIPIQFVARPPDERKKIQDYFRTNTLFQTDPLQHSDRFLDDYYATTDGVVTLWDKEYNPYMSSPAVK